MDAELADSFGGMRKFSLQPLAEVPADTYIDLMFVHSPPGGFQQGDIGPHSVVLSEFIAPPDTSPPGLA
ncbi:hypothetical protein [Nocardia sp. NPDC048505]|uniref:hypothetical protein n=1 Tax=unclassified Nocardia TaxID=2637762 RepID=UPI00340DDF70